MALVDLNTIHNPATGTSPPASWGDAVRDNFEFFASAPQCSIKETTPLSVAHNTATALTSNEENFDTDNMHSTTTQTSRITIQTAGSYEFSATVKFAGDVDGYRAAKFTVNATTDYVLFQLPAVVSTDFWSSGSLPIPSLIVGDYVELVVQHTAGGALDVTMANFGARWVSR